MQIKTVKLKNFRGYKNETTINFENLTVLVGKNDSGKSTVLEALDIFFNDGKNIIKIDKNDVNVRSREDGDLETVISVVFTDLPKEIEIDSSFKTSLRREYLLNNDDCLEIIKKYHDGGSPKVYIKAKHPTNENCSELLLKKNTSLKSIIKENNIECSNMTVNSIMRTAIWNYYEKHDKDGLKLREVEIDASKEDAKQIWDKLSIEMPVYSLFQADRSNTDSDSEVQDPLKEAVKRILSDPEIKAILERVSKKVLENLREVSNRTLEKLKDLNLEVATSLSPVIPTADKLKWFDVFKSVSISGDDNIPINKRGSGVKRLILISFFTSEAERLAKESKTSQAKNGIIYAIEEPETSQHTNNQKTLIESFIKIAKEPGAQVILTTHSAYIVKKLDYANLRIISDNKNNEKEILPVKKSCLKYPSLNEVNYLAFNEISVEYHDELYGELQFECREISRRSNNNQKDGKSDKGATKRINEKDFDNWLNEKGIKKNKDYKRDDGEGTYKVTLQTYIRDLIHHPENKSNRMYTEEELSKSIEEMKDIYINLNGKNKNSSDIVDERRIV
ncbi:ATP-binding protein [Gardnerella sp. KA00390]|uniref:ATP-binding protein n=1 Tax=Gardnerella sp. KA00390 TaxID=2749075 RepID=UPI003BAAC9C5